MTPLRRWNATPLALAALTVTTLMLAACTPGHTLRPGSPVGRWGDADDHEAHLTLEEDGTALGHDGCNSFGGQWDLVNGTVIFDDMYTTLVACPGDEYWLGGMDSAVVIGDALHVLDDEGHEIGVLPRSAAD
ncbi:META domain-containing protein [Microbacterium sp. CFH 90308]|uniref:META domain-containing protein n=1 Tax=Microbacterium salsuginis TaxID=2722803 RepID=A0ABX1KGW4_9MICO|nr:META domain-containing protein [Microbacterium sp. CFH 90308]NLP86134.1 META domain-containing protein [Microbacterium sp. CFH 90308]